jgi:hypothetical protein
MRPAALVLLAFSAFVSATVITLQRPSRFHHANFKYQKSQSCNAADAEPIDAQLAALGVTAALIGEVGIFITGDIRKRDLIEKRDLTCASIAASSEPNQEKSRARM